MPRDLADAPVTSARALRPAVLDIVSQRLAAEDDEALDDAILLAELRRAVEGARTGAEDLLRRYHPDWDDRLDRIYARYTD
jgi:gamma-glutamylcysteine synthetase